MYGTSAVKRTAERAEQWVGNGGLVHASTIRGGARREGRYRNSSAGSGDSCMLARGYPV